MKKFIIKSIFLCAALTLLFVLLYLLSREILTSFEVDFSIAALVLAVIIILIVWISTKALKLISSSISFVYWIFCLGVSIATLCITLNSTLDFSIFAIHITGLLFLIPEMAGGWLTKYTKPKTSENPNSDVPSSETAYIPGCIVKFATMILIAASFTVLELFIHTAFIWLIFIAEAIYSLYFICVNVKNFFFSK